MPVPPGHLATRGQDYRHCAVPSSSLFLGQALLPSTLPETWTRPVLRAGGGGGGGGGGVGGVQDTSLQISTTSSPFISRLNVSFALFCSKAHFSDSEQSHSECTCRHVSVRLPVSDRHLNIFTFQRTLPFQLFSEKQRRQFDAEIQLLLTLSFSPSSRTGVTLTGTARPVVRPTGFWPFWSPSNKQVFFYLQF